MRQLARKLLRRFPEPVQSYIIERGRRLQDRQYIKQSCIPIQIGRFEIEVPRNHILTNILKSQPYRDLSVGLTAKFVTQKYEDASIVDIGANVGDTAAIIATYTPNPLILVEPSEFFFGILQRNVRNLPNPVTLKRAFVASGKPLSGSLHYRGGTAYFHEQSNGAQTQTTVRLCEIADGKTRFVKIDTDGFDVPILNNSLEWLAAQRPTVLFECSVTNEDELRNTDHLYGDLSQIGYEHFIAWDDAGFCILSTDDVGAMKDLDRYLFNLKRSNFARAISNLDIACFHSADADIYTNIREWYRSN